MPDTNWDGLERRQERRVEMLNLHARMTRQDELLADIRAAQVRQLAEQATVKPSLDELIKILDGVKFLRTVTIIVAPAAAVLLAAITWIKDHIKWT